MSPDFDHGNDPVAATVFLAAEAAVLAERIRMLRGQLADVSARILETAEELDGLHAPSHDSEEHDVQQKEPVRNTGQDGDAGHCPGQMDRSAPCGP